MRNKGEHSGSGNRNGASASNNEARASIPVDWEQLARSTAHPLRISILEILGLDGGRTLSPTELCRELQLPLSNTNYHVTELAKAGLIELDSTRQVRGATEHFYKLPAARRKRPARTASREPASAGRARTE